MLFVKLPTFLKEIGLPHEGAEEILFNITAYYIKTPIVLFLEERYESPFVVENVPYPTAEHWMMAQKALLFDDKKSFEKIYKKFI